MHVQHIAHNEFIHARAGTIPRVPAPR